MPLSCVNGIDSVHPSSSRHSSTSSLRRQSQIESPVSASSSLETPRESAYPEVPEMYHNARLNPTKFLESQFYL
jgi:hypothetical protein